MVKEESEKKNSKLSNFECRIKCPDGEKTIRMEFGTAIGNHFSKVMFFEGFRGTCVGKLRVKELTPFERTGRESGKGELVIKK